SGQMAPLVSLADAQFYNVVNQGEGRSLLTILAEVEIGESNLPEPEVIKFLLARGRLQNILGELKTAEVDLKQAAEMLNHMPQTAETDRLKGEVCLAMGELLERQDPPEALRWVQRGLGLSQSAELRLLEGILHYHTGNFGEALESLHDGLESLPQSRQLERGKAYNMLGAVNGSLGKMADAKAYSLRALELGRSIGDHVEVTQSLSNLGWFRYVLGERDEAVDNLFSGIELAQRLGARDKEMSGQINLGGCFVEMGKVEQAKVHLARGAELARSGNSHQLTTALIRLGELAVQEEAWENAESLLDEANRLAVDKNDQAALAGIYGFQALAAAGINDFERATELVKKGVALDQLLGDQWSLGINLRVQGRIALLQGDFLAARKAFERSILTLETVDSFQAAISILDWAIGLIQQGNGVQSSSLLEKAKIEIEKYPDSPEFKRLKYWQALRPS
ncbi:MAG: tetratricopeptide repeat protein, partial [Anaerolineae bacterium]